MAYTSKNASNTNLTKYRGWTQVLRMVSNSCSTSGTRRVNLVTKPVISHEWGKDREVLTASSAGFTNRLDRLKSRASKFRRPPANLYNTFNTVISFHFKYFIDKSIGLDNRLCLYKSSPTTRWNHLNTIYIRHRAIYPTLLLNFHTYAVLAHSTL
jgi:hypothetical protein